MKTTMKRLTAVFVALLVCVGVVSAATTLPSGWSTTKPSGSVVSVYGSTTTYGGESQAIKSARSTRASGIIRFPIRRIPITRVSGFLR